MGQSTLPPGPPSDDGLEAIRARLGILEVKVDELGRKSEKMDDTLRQAQISLARVDGNLDLLVKQIAGKLPTWWQLPAAIVAIVGLIGVVIAIGDRLHLLTK